MRAYHHHDCPSGVDFNTAAFFKLDGEEIIFYFVHKIRNYPDRTRVVSDLQVVEKQSPQPQGNPLENPLSNPLSNPLANPLENPQGNPLENPLAKKPQKPPRQHHTNWPPTQFEHETTITWQKGVIRFKHKHSITDIVHPVSSTLSVPATWDRMDDPQQTLVVKLPDGREREDILSLFHMNMERRRVGVISVGRVQNPDLWTQYLVLRNNMIMREKRKNEAMSVTAAR